MHNFKRIMRAAAFIIVVIVLMNACNFIFAQSGYTRYIIHQVDNPGTKDGYDTVIIGASHGRAGVDPAVLDEYGASDNTVNLCIPGAFIRDNYYLLREAAAHNKIKKVILEMDYQYWCNYKGGEFIETAVYSHLPLSTRKIDFIWNNLLDKDFRTTFVNKNSWVSDFSGIKSNIKLKMSKAYRDYDISAVIDKDAYGEYKGKGFYYRTQRAEDKGQFEPFAWDENDVGKTPLKYFQKIVEFCKKNNIELTCVTTTITPKAALDGVSEETGRWFANLCSQNGVRYIDFNLVSLDELERTDDDFADWEGHMMGWMAEKYSEVLAKVIRGDNIRFYKDYQEYRMAYESRKGIK